MHRSILHWRTIYRSVIIGENLTNPQISDNKGDRVYIVLTGFLFVFACLIRFFTTKSTNFQLGWDGFSWVEIVLSKDKCVLLKNNNTVTPVRLETTHPRSRVKHSTTVLPVFLFVSQKIHRPTVSASAVNLLHQKRTLGETLIFVLLSAYF